MNKPLDYASVTQAEVHPSIPDSGDLATKLDFIIEQLKLAQDDLRECLKEYDYENPDMEESRYLDRQNARAINRKFE